MARHANSSISDPEGTLEPIQEKYPEPANTGTEKFTVQDLLQVIQGMQKQQAQQAENAQLATAALVEAILESKKPYVNPLIAENERKFNEQREEIAKRAKVLEKAVQNQCQHIAGSSNLSEAQDLYGRTSIIWHRGDVGQTYGICTTCGRQFHQDDPDFALWRSKRSFNKESRSGDRYVPNPVEAQKESRLEDK